MVNCHNIAMIKHLGTNLQRLNVLSCFEYQSGITNEEEDLMFVSEPELFSIGTINLTLNTVSVVVINIMQIGRTIDIADPIIEFILIHGGSTETIVDKEPRTSLKNKVYLEIYYHHKPSQV
jgi:hypothetical protein